MYYCSDFTVISSDFLKSFVWFLYFYDITKKFTNSESFHKSFPVIL